MPILNDEIPLCVDLDGSLVNTDTLVESALLLTKSNPLYIFAMIFWLLSGKANLKEQIASRIKLDVTILPYNQPLLVWLRGEREAGRNLVMATAANHRIAEEISDYLQLFSRVIASSGKRNLGAGSKRDELVQLFGEGQFDYVGNSRDDLKVWPSCRRAVLVNASTAVSSRAAKLAEIEISFPRSQNTLLALLSAMRPHEWGKFLLIFVSIPVAQGDTDTHLLVSTFVAFVAFCLCSSSVYMINDLLGLEVDRKHHEKRNRPFASGRAPLMLGILVTPLLLMISAALAWNLGKLFFGVIVLYFGLTLGYCFYMKRLAKK